MTEPKELTTIQPKAVPTTLTAIRRLEWFTVTWMTIEVMVALTAAVLSRSVVLAAFGADSAIELLSAATILWRFRSRRTQTEATARKTTGWLLVALAVFIVCQSVYTLFGAGPQPRSSYLGIALLVAGAIVMPWLARRKRDLAATMHSASLRADAAQSSVCAYMSWIALAGLLMNAIGHISWADPVAALCLVPVVLREGKEALEGHTCGN